MKAKLAKFDVSVTKYIEALEEGKLVVSCCH